MIARAISLFLLLFATTAQAAEKPTYVRAPVLRAVGSAGEVAITSEVMSAAALLVTAAPGWSEWPTTGTPPCSNGCWLVEAHCSGDDTQHCTVVVSEQPSGRQASGQLTVRGLAPSTDVAQALVLQAAYLLEKLRQAPETRSSPAMSAALQEAPEDRATDQWEASIGPSLLASSGISAWGLEAAVILSVSRRAFVRVSAGYSGLLASASGTRLDYFHAVPLSASFGVRGTWAGVTATASLGLTVIPVFASTDHVADSDLAVDGCVELGLRYPLGNTFWIAALARPYYGSGDVTLGEGGNEPFVLPKWGILSTLQIGALL